MNFVCLILMMVSALSQTAGAGNLYEALGLAPGASPAEIKAAHRRQVKLLHPDRIGPQGDVEPFRQVQEAYDILGNEDRRAVYDRQFQQPLPAHPKGSSLRPSEQSVDSDWFYAFLYRKVQILRWEFKDGPEPQVQELQFILLLRWLYDPDGRSLGTVSPVEQNLDPGKEKLQIFYRQLIDASFPAELRAQAYASFQQRVGLGRAIAQLIDSSMAVRPVASRAVQNVYGQLLKAFWQMSSGPERSKRFQSLAIWFVNDPAYKKHMGRSWAVFKRLVNQAGREDPRLEPLRVQMRRLSFFTRCVDFLLAR